LIKKDTKKILLYSDLHCGSETGLTPYKYIAEKIDIPGLSDLRRQYWAWWLKSIKESGKFDVAVANGDLIDGTGYKDKGIYQDTTNIEWQQKIAIEVLNTINTKKHFIVRGTKYHVMDVLEAENAIAAALGAVIDDAIIFKCNGKLFKVKHKGTRGGVPHSATPKLGKRIWDIISSYAYGEDIPDFSIRSHAHEKFYCETDFGVFIQTPCLQLKGRSAYGRGIDGLYSVGFMVIEIDKNGDFIKHERIFKIKSKTKRTLKI